MRGTMVSHYSNDGLVAGRLRATGAPGSVPGLVSNRLSPITWGPMPEKDESEHEYRGWKIRITQKPVEAGSTAMIEVWKTGYDPRTQSSMVLPCLARGASPAEAHATAMKTAREWIDQRGR